MPDMVFIGGVYWCLTNMVFIAECYNSGADDLPTEPKERQIFIGLLYIIN